MAAPKRTETQREEDLAKTAELYNTGHPQAEIARRLGVSREQIGYDLKILRARWREAQLRNTDEHLVDELERLDALEREAWAAWRRSQTDQEKTATEEVLRSIEVEGTDHGQHPVETRKRVEKLGRHGDARFLEVVMRCIDKRCEIRGLDAPKKIELKQKSAPAENGWFERALEAATMEELDALELVAKLQEKYTKPNPPQPPTP